MPVTERNVSDMIRSSGEVLREAERQDVVLRRRDGADMMLVDLEREQAIRQSLGDAARIIARLGAGSPTSVKRLGASLPAALPWTGFLPPAERLRFLEEFTATATACIETEVFEPLAQLSREWRATAAVHADPRLRATLRGPADADDSVVPRPSG